MGTYTAKSLLSVAWSLILWV